MKKVFALIIAVSLILALLPAGMALAKQPGENERGNGLPKDMGKSFNFNVIAVRDASHNGWDDDSGGNGKRIFIKDTGTTSLYVHGDNVTQNLEITDRNGIDGSIGTRAEPGIILPYEGVPGDGGVWACQIYVRVLGPANDAENKITGQLKYWGGDAYQPIGGTFELKRDMNNQFKIKNGVLLDDRYQDLLWEWTPDLRFKMMQFRIYVWPKPH